MAAFAVTRGTSGLLHGLRASFRGFAQAKHGNVAAAVAPTSQRRDCRWYCVGNLSVKDRIDRKRGAALVGGGQNRIDAQHKRVTELFACSGTSFGRINADWGPFPLSLANTLAYRFLVVVEWCQYLTSVARHVPFICALNVLTAACFEA